MLVRVTVSTPHKLPKTRVKNPSALFRLPQRGLGLYAPLVALRMVALATLVMASATLIMKLARNHPIDHQADTTAVSRRVNFGEGWCFVASSTM